MPVFLISELQLIELCNKTDECMKLRHSGDCQRCLSVEQGPPLCRANYVGAVDVFKPCVEQHSQSTKPFPKITRIFENMYSCQVHARW
jgi:hypothetical protein